MTFTPDINPAGEPHEESGLTGPQREHQHDHDSAALSSALLDQLIGPPLLAVTGAAAQRSA